MDANMIASGHRDGTLRFWDARTGGLVSEVAGLHTSEICSLSAGLHSGQPQRHFSKLWHISQDCVLKILRGDTVSLLSVTLHFTGYYLGMPLMTLGDKSLLLLLPF